MTTELYEVLIAKYSERMGSLMKSVERDLKDKGFTVDGCASMYGDDYRWTIYVKMGEDENEDVNIDLILVDGKEYDGTENGMTFKLDIVEVGGRILGGLCPYNYTDKCWVDPTDAKAVEERWQLLVEGVNVDGIVKCLEDV